jgi:hypothetical protein
VVALAREWMNTPYNPNQKVKGAGTDCAMYPLAVYQEAGKIPLEVAVPFYPPDWHMHRDEEKYLNFVREVCELAGGREITPTRLSPATSFCGRSGALIRMAPSWWTGRSAFTATFRTASRCSTPSIEARLHDHPRTVLHLLERKLNDGRRQTRSKAGRVEAEHPAHAQDPDFGLRAMHPHHLRHAAPRDAPAVGGRLRGHPAHLHADHRWQGRRGSQTTTTTTYSYQTALEAALCEGPISAIRNMWDEKGHSFLSRTTASFTVPGPGGTFTATPPAGNIYLDDLGVTRNDSFSVAGVNDYGSDGAVTLSGTQKTPMVKVIGAPGAGNIRFPATSTPSPRPMPAR